MNVAVPKLMIGLPLVVLVCGAIILALIILINTGHRRFVLFILSLPFCLLLALVAIRIYSEMAERRRVTVDVGTWETGRQSTVHVQDQSAELERKEAELQELRQKLAALEQPASRSPLSEDEKTGAAEPTEMPSSDTKATVVAADQPGLDNGEHAGQVPAAEPTETAAVPGDEGTPGKPSTRDSVPPDRPDWVDQLPIREGKVHAQVAMAEPFATLAECENSVADDIARAVSDYNSWYSRQHHPSEGQLIRVPRFDWSHARRHSELVQYGVGPMHNLYVLLEFDEIYRRELDDCRRDTMVASRLTRVGLISGAVIALLATLLVYLRLDVSTEGRFSRRLQFAAAAAILAVTASGVLLYRWVPWM